MNFSQFYGEANKQLLEALSNLWFKGHPKEKEHFEKLISTKEPLISEPVFQSIFPWKNAEYTFMEHATKLKILTPDFVQALDSVTDEGFRFPADRHPYTHQSESWKAMLDETNRKTIVVTSGTGSGKTECFMIPVLQDLALHRSDGIQAIFLYPLNALMSDQQRRIHEWCKALNIRYAIYNGDTIENDPGQLKKSENYPRLLSRDEIRQNPPQVLFTNPTLLNYLLVRDKDKNILKISKANKSLRWILLDEAHTYSGSSATELALQIRRVIDALGELENVNFAVTSATMGGNDPNSIFMLKKMVNGLTGKPISNIEVINGYRVVPVMKDAVMNKRLVEINSRFGCSITKTDIVALRNELNAKQLSLHEITSVILKKTVPVDKQLALVDALAEKVTGLVAVDKEDALLPARAHFMIRAINGIYTCTNPNCPDKDPSDPAIGHFTTHLSTICPHPDCHAPMLEIVACASCGELLLVGNNSSQNGYSMRLNSYVTEDDLFDTPDDDDNNINAHLDEELFVVSKCNHPCPREHAATEHIKFNHIKGTIEIGGGSDSFVETMVDGQHVCPHCGKSLGYKDLKSFCVGAPFLGQILANTLLGQAEPASQTAGTIHYGQKYITFTDSRQATAKSAMTINQEVERTWIRTQIFQYLANQRMEDYSPGGLTVEEQEEYDEYRSYENPGPRIQRKLRELEEKMAGGHEPNFKPVEWDTIKRALIGQQELKQMYEHIAEARLGNSSRSFLSSSPSDREGYLNALFINQMGRAPRRANSLETLGLVRLVYPKIDVQKAPTCFINAGLTQEDWTAFLYTCLNFSIREKYHYEIPFGAAKYLVQDSHTVPVFGPDTTLTSLPSTTTEQGEKKINKWPLVRVKQDGTPWEQQDKLVLLLCAALGYTYPDSINVDLVNRILREAWAQISMYALEKVETTDMNPANHGYMLRLTDPDKVKISLIREGWVCPVEHAIVTDNFRGYSPRMKGFVNRDNFQRYLIKEHLTYPFFPYPLNHKFIDANHNYIPVNQEEINAWIDANWKDKMDKGQFSDIIRDILTIRPIFITAEHSAQLNQAIREKSVELFKAGILNILACSTTMEMGVDISGISEVVMNTVPPKPANYLQRAGRAGRRGETKAMAVTFCSATPIGNESWNNPDWPMTHETQLPLIKMESRPIVQRHVNAMLFAYFVQNAGGMSVTSKVKDFFDTSACDHFKEALQRLQLKVNPVQYSTVKNSYDNLVKDTILVSQSLEDCISVTLQEVERVKTVYREQVDAIGTILSAMTRQDAAYKVNNNKLKRVQSTNLLSFLSENAFLPSAGMPIGLVEFVNEHEKLNRWPSDDNEEGFIRKKVFPTKHISQAITEYAPGNQVVINEWCYTSAGVGLRSPFNNTNRAVLQQCSACKYTTVSVGDPLSDCPECGSQGTMHGVMEATAFTEMVEPISFCVDDNRSPSRVFRGEYAGYAIPKMLNMPPWPTRSQGAKYVIRSSSDSQGSKNPEILFVNRGANKLGYAYCPFCGRMESMPVDDTIEPLARHLRLDSNTPCDSAQMGHIRKNVVLSGRYQTDFVEIQFYDAADQVITDDRLLYSLGVIITRKLGEILGINDGEIGFGLNGDYNSIFIYDTAIGGAGYSILLREFSSKVLDAALDDLKGCDCEKACTKCLIDRRTQWSLDLLDRNIAIQWLELEKASRTAPQDAIDQFGPEVSALTCDITSHICSLVNSGNLTKLLFCLSSDVSKWSPNDFPYLHLMGELKRGGCDTAFLMQNSISITALRPAQLSNTVDSFMKGDFYLGTLDCGAMRPVMYAEFAGGRKLVYFGDSPDLSFSGSWGSGKLYCAPYPIVPSFSKLNTVQLISSLAASKFVAHFTITQKHILSSDLLSTIVSVSGRPDWFKISDKLGGKNVTIDYTDKHLNSPFAVFILVSLLAQLKKKFNFNIQAVRLHLGFYRDEARPDAKEIQRYFRDTLEQNTFIYDCFALIGIRPNISRDRVGQHERDIIISDGVTELSILPNGGVAWGWTLDDSNTEYNVKADLLNNDSNPLLYNYADKGITYTIVLSD